MKKSRYFNILCSLFALLAITFSCKESMHDHDHDHAHEGEEAHNEGHEHGVDEIILPVEKARAAGVKTMKVARGTFHDVIEASGKIMAASCDETTVVATVAGIVGHAQHISEGMAIGKGTTLFTVSSSRLQEGDQARRILISYQAARREYERAKALVADKIVSEKDFAAI